MADEHICGECSEYKSIDFDTGRCKLCGHTWIRPSNPACPPRLREIKALEEIERLKAKLDRQGRLAVGLPPPPNIR